MQRVQHIFPLKKALLGAAVAVSITACSTAPRQPLAVDDSWQSITQSSRSQQLSDLLTAEFTLQRQGSTVATPLYLQAASDTQDAGVAKRATTTAMVSEQNDAVLQATQQWLAVAPEAEQAYPVRLQALLLAEDIDGARALLQQALDHQVSLAFLPEFVDQNVRHTDTTSLLYNVLNTPTLADQPSVEVALFHLKFLAGEYQAVVDGIDPLLKRASAETKPALLVIKAVSQEQIGWPERAQKTLENGLAEFPDSDRILGNLLELMVKNQHIDDALQTFYAAELSDPQKQQIGLAIGQQLLIEQHPEQSAAVLSQLPRQGGLSNQIHFFLANAQQQLGDNEAALHNLANVFGQLSWNASQLLVEWFYQADQSEQVNPIILKRAAAEQEPGHIIGVAELHQQNGRTDLAFDLLNQALANFPNLDAVRYKRAILYDGQEQWQAAIKDLKLLVKKHPNDPAYINALGYTMMVRSPEQLNKALALIEKAYQLDPTDPAIIDSLGWAYYLQGDLAQAQDLLSDAWQSLQDAEIGAHYGEVLWQQGKKTAALAIWREAMDLDPELPTLRHTLQQYAPQLLDRE